MNSGVIQDLQYGIRSLLRQPGHALTSVLTLGLGIGASTAIFTLVNAIVLQPLPFRDPERLVWVSSKRSNPGNLPFTLPDFLEFRDGCRTLEGIAAYGNWSANLTGRDEPERLPGVRISADAFELLGVHAAIGRALRPGDDTPGQEHVVVLGDALWRRRFHADPGVVGQSLVLNGAAYTVVGVLGSRFVFPIPTAELAVPLAPESDPWRTLRNSSNFLYAWARLKPGVAREQAEADLTVIADRLRRQYPDSNARKLGVTLIPLHEHIVGNFRGALWMLLGAVGVLLLISCVNLAGLSLVRAAARQQEFAIRTALGASGRRLVQQLLTESLLLSVAGGAVGWMIACWSVPLLLAVSPQSLPRSAEVGVDLRVLGFALALSILTGAIFAIAPCFQATGVDLLDELKQEGRGASGGVKRNRARRVLVVAELALSVVLLAGAGLLIRSFVRLEAVPPGFDAHHLLAVRLSLPQARYPDRAALLSFYETLALRLERVPGVGRVGFVSLMPLSGILSKVSFTVEGRATPPEESLVTDYRVVGRDYFQTLRIPLISGRSFDGRDRPGTAPAVLISASFARRYWPNGGAVGAHLHIDDNDVGPRQVEVVGVVGDVKDAALDDEPIPHLYLPIQQVPEDGLVWLTRAQYWMIRTKVAPATLAAAVRREIHAVDSDAPATEIRPMEDYLEASVAPRRFSLWLLIVFAGAALALAAMGLYGVISQGVAQRRRELGIRMALGAQAEDVFRLVIGQGLRLAVVGVGIGLAAAFALTRLMSSLLFGVRPADPGTFVAIALLQLAVAVLACYVPARRAMRVDPMLALR